MDADAGKRSTVAVVAALLIIAIIYFLVPSKPDTPKGIFLPSDKLMTPVSLNSVNFFSPNSLPMAYRKIGQISVMLHSVDATVQGQIAIETYAKQLAASAGANGIIVTLFGHTLLGKVPSPQAAYAFRGVGVYFVPNT